MDVQMPDGTIITGVPEGITQTELLARYQKYTAPKERTVGEAVKDVGAGLVTGVGSLVQIPGQLYGLTTGDFSKTGALGLGQDIEEYGKGMKSAGLKAREAARSAKVQEAEKEGQLSAFMSALGETVTDPALLTTFLAEQAPQLIPMILTGVGAGAIASRGVMSAATARGAAEEAAKRLASKKAVQAGTTAAIQTGAVMQGADVGAGAYDEIFRELVAKGVPTEQAAAETINKARLAGLAGYGLSVLANRYLPGGKALEEVLAGKKLAGSRLGTAAVTGLKEIPGENIEEVGGRIAQNIAAQQAGLERDTLSGVGETAAMATIGAAGMGGGAGLLAGRARAPEEAIPPTPPVTAEEQPTGPVEGGAPPAAPRTLESFFEEKKPPAEITDEALKGMMAEYATRDAEIKEMEARGVTLTNQERGLLLGKRKKNEKLKAQIEDAIAKTESQGAQDVAGTDEQAGGAGAPVPPQPAQPTAPAAGTQPPQPDGVVPTGSDAGLAAQGETGKPASVTPAAVPPTPPTPLAPELQAGADLIAAIDQGGVPLNPAKLNQVARDIGLEVPKTAKPEETISRIREAVTRAQNQPQGAPLGTQTPEAQQAETQGQQAPAASTDVVTPERTPREVLLDTRKAQAEALGIDLRDIQQNEIDEQLAETEKRLGEKFDEERTNVVYDEEALNFIEEAEKGNLSPQFGWEGEGLGALADMLDRNGVDSDDILGKDVDRIADDIRNATLQEALKALRSKREQLREWGRLTNDQRRVYLDNLKTNELGQITPLARQRALEALNRYTSNKDRTNSGEIQADRVEGLYETQRAAYEKKHGIVLPKYSELSEEDRAKLKADFKFRKSKNKTVDPTVQSIDTAFKNLADAIKKRGEARATNAAERVEERAKREKQELQVSEFRAYERAQNEAKEERRDEEDETRSAATFAETEKPLPGPIVDAIRSGNMSAVFSWLINSIPNPNRTMGIKFQRVLAARLNGLKLKTKIQFVESLPDGDLAQYDPKTDTISVTMGGMKPSIILHELVHAATIKILDRVQRNDVANLTPSQIDAANQLDDLMALTAPALSETYPEAYKNILEFVSYAMTNREFQKGLQQFPTNKLKNTVLKERNALSKFMDYVVRILNLEKLFAPSGGVTSTNLLAEVAASFEQIISVPEGGIERAPLPAKKPASKQERKKAPPERAPTTEEVLKRNELPELSTVSKIRQQYTTRKAYNLLKKKFQNSRDAIKRLEDAAVRAGKVIFDGTKLNSVYTSIVLASGRAKDLFLTRVEPSASKLRQAIDAYAKKTGQTVEEAARDLHVIAMAMHEGERRDVLYMLNVPLSNKKTSITLPNGKTINIAPSEYRSRVMDAIFSGELSKSEVVDLRKSLDAVIAQHKDALGISGFGPDAGPISFGSEAPTKEKLDALLDRNSYLYNVVGGYSPEVTQKILDDLYNSSKAKGVIDEALKAMKGLHQATRELDKESNYWSKPVQSVVDFYGWENYIPLKGKQKYTGKNDDMLDFDGPRIGKDYQESQNPFEGRETDSDNSLIQSMVDATRAAMRAGRKDVTLAIKNAVNDKLLYGAIVKENIPFADRLSIPDMTVKDENGRDVPINGPNFIFHYKPDGTIDIIRLSDKDQREAIKRTYQDSQPLIDGLNWLTSKVGQMHTRYNVAFAPMNFVRDALTNAFMLGADMGPKVAAQYIGAVAAKVVNGGMYKAFRVAKLYESGKFDEIARLAKKDPYIAAMYDYIQEGGKVSYLQGISSKSQQQELQRDLTSSNLKKAGAAVNKVLDIWNDMFELASRTAAYEITKSQEMARGLGEAAASKKAAGYAKNLANFEQTGEWGRAAGAMFMFFRPAATGAVRAIEALEPAFRSVESAMADLPMKVREDKEAMKTFRQEYEQRKRNAQVMSMGLMGMGAMMYMMAYAMADDDDQGRNRVGTDDATRWSRYARFFVPGMETPIQIPWGFGLGAFAAAGAQMASIGMGNTSIKDALTNTVLIGMDSFLPLPVSRINPMDQPAAWLMDSALPSALRPFLEWTMNLDGLGREIYNNRQSRYGDAYTGGDNIPELYKSAARMLYDATSGGVDVSPNTLYFFANNYLDGVSRLGAGAMNIGMVAAGNKEFNPKTDTIVFDSFFGAPSNIDAREFSNAEKKILSIQQRMKTLQANHPDKYVDYISDNPTHKFIVDSYNRQVNQTLRDLREQANVYRRMPELTVKERTELVKNIVGTQNLVKRNILNMMDALELDY